MDLYAQYILVWLVIISAMAYCVHLIKNMLDEIKSGCYGCSGCSLKKEIIKNKLRKIKKNTKSKCFSRKI